MSRRETIEAKIVAALAPAHLEVIDESHMHSVPPDAQSHFRLVIVSQAFADQPLVRRHQTVNRLLADEIADGLHALSMETLTAEEWARRDRRARVSPPCRGGGKADE
ncbi:MAG: BolA family protein [Alphaproteobacteria bacterium]